MNIGDLLTRDSILLSVKASSYQSALEQAAIHLSYLTELRPQHIQAVLLERESRGSTALGGGVALPHARIEGLLHPYALFMRFLEPVVTETPDSKPVDMAFVVLAPQGANATYLRAVGKIATILKSEDKRELLFSSLDKDFIYAMLISEDA